MTLRRLVTWKLGPKPTKEALAHELTTRQCKLFVLLHFGWLVCLDSDASFSHIGMATMKENKGKGIAGDEIV